MCINSNEISLIVMKPIICIYSNAAINSYKSVMCINSNEVVNGNKSVTYI